MRIVSCCIIAFGLWTQAAPLGAQTTITRTDGYVMGAGRWTCDDALRVAQSGTPAQTGDLAGWILGFWSASTFQRETSFVDTVEQVGGRQIYIATMEECQKAPGQTLLHVVVRSMIKNTK